MVRRWKRLSPLRPAQGEGSLDHPTIATELVAAVDATAGDTRLDGTPAASAPAAAVVVSLVGMEFGGPAARVTPLAGDRRDAIEQRGEGHAIVEIGRGQQHSKRHSLPIGQKMAQRRDERPQLISYNRCTHTLEKGRKALLGLRCVVVDVALLTELGDDEFPHLALLPIARRPGQHVIGMEAVQRQEETPG